MDQLETLRKQFQETTGKKPDKRWSEDRLLHELEVWESKPQKAPPLDLGETDLRMKGNMTGGLKDDHPAKDYTFENKVLAPVGPRNPKPVRVSDRYHIWITPCILIKSGSQGKMNRVPDPAQTPYRTLLSPLEWQDTRKRFEKATNMTFDILHDPTR